jgi:hypothetical protein
MEKTIYYKDHTIILDGITATIYHNGSYIYKTRFIDAVETVKSLKAFINLRLDQQKRDRGVNVYA